MKNIWTIWTTGGLLLLTAAWFVFNALGGDAISKVPKILPDWLEDWHYEWDNTNDYFGRPRGIPSMPRVLFRVNEARQAIGLPALDALPDCQNVPNNFGESGFVAADGRSISLGHVFTRTMCPIGVALGGIGLNMRFVRYDSADKAMAVARAWGTHLSSQENVYVFLPTVIRRFLKAQRWDMLPDFPDP